MLAATTRDRFIAWQGVAGAGKSYALKQFRQIAESQGYRVRGFAPSAEAAKSLGRLGPNSAGGNGGGVAVCSTGGAEPGSARGLGGRRGGALECQGCAGPGDQGPGAAG